jgi:adenylate kinase
MKPGQTLKVILTAMALIAISAPATSVAQSEEGHLINVLREEVEKATKKGRKGAGSRHQRGAASSRRYQNSREALDKLKAGELVSDDSLNAIVASEVLSSDASQGFILDGYPMSVAQAEFLDAIMDARGISPFTVIYLNIPDEESLKRMSERDRSDYKRGFGEERLRGFREAIVPIIDYYGEGVVHEIDGTRSEEQITAEILTVLLQ